MIPFVYLFISLSIMSYMDFKKKVVENYVTFGFILGSVFFALINTQSIEFLGPMGLAIVLSYVLWSYKIIGGADVKVLIGMAALMSFVEIFNVLTLAVVILLILSWKFSEDHRIAFIPIIYISYCGLYIFNNIFI